MKFPEKLHEPIANRSPILDEGSNDKDRRSVLQKILAGSVALATGLFVSRAEAHCFCWDCNPSSPWCFYSEGLCWSEELLTYLIQGHIRSVAPHSGTCCPGLTGTVLCSSVCSPDSC